MSGGSYNYAYRHIDEIADKLVNSKSALRRAFGRHLQLVAKACHDIEWVDSCDYGEGDDVLAINAALGHTGPGLVLSEIVAQAEAVRDELDKAIREAKQ